MISQSLQLSSDGCVTASDHICIFLSGTHSSLHSDLERASTGKKRLLLTLFHMGGPKPNFSTLRRKDTRYDDQTFVTFTQIQLAIKI